MASKREKTVIEAFLRGHNKEFDTTWRIKEWPDEIEGATRSGEQKEAIDAFAADSEGRGLALEHTTIEAFMEATANDAAFEPLVSAFRNPAMRVPGYHIIAYMAPDSLRGLRRAQRETLARELAVRFNQVRLRLPDGTSEQTLDSRGRRFVVEFFKRPMPGDHPGLVTFQRPLKPNFLPRLREAIDKKLDKLTDFKKGQDILRILLLERRDYDTPNFWEVHKALEEIERECHLCDLSEVWLANTSKLTFGDCASGGPFIEFNSVWPTVGSRGFFEPVNESEAKAARSER